jgi:hypothetical protein
MKLKALGHDAEAKLLKVGAGKPTMIETGFTFELSTEDLRNFKTDEPSFDLIYFDAFAPSAQPELWSEEVFQAMYDALLPGGALVTYCAKGVVKRTMKSVGFEVEALPGPPRKERDDARMEEMIKVQCTLLCTHTLETKPNSGDARAVARC